METKIIVKKLAEGDYGHEGDLEITKPELIDELCSGVMPLCETSTMGEGGTTTLWDWLYEGDYDGSETAESLAAEWDELSEAAE